MDTSTEAFIAQLYRSTQHIALGHFRQWALEGLRTHIDFSAAIWSTGHLSTRSFHTHTVLGLPENYPQRLLEYLPLNPISKRLFNHPEQPVDMADVVSDGEFYSSRIYKELFGPLGIERILSSISIESRSGLYTLITLYRSERGAVFMPQEKARHQRLLFHLLQSSSQARISHLRQFKTVSDDLNSHAICDQHGIYHEVEPGFLDLMEENYPQAQSQQLPFALPETVHPQVFDGLHVQCEQLGDLYRLAARPARPFDQLTLREQEVVTAVTKGLSFKQAARNMNLSPSTVSNHLYRVYQKLNISNRAELADLIARKDA